MGRVVFRPGIGAVEVPDDYDGVASNMSADVAAEATSVAFADKQEADLAAERADFEGSEPPPAQVIPIRPGSPKPAAKPKRYVESTTRDVLRDIKASIRELSVIVRAGERAKKKRDELQRIVAATHRPKAGAKRRPDTENKNQ
jgi:hypothetical protein